uniref:Uncharacterized protein simX7 n=1 Tax=Streptomyces antibioticus TaxID=1890 RepID=G9VYV2_STRAT|nr:hypothetical protein [Streptomyces antibioticus]
MAETVADPTAQAPDGAGDSVVAVGETPGQRTGSAGTGEPVGHTRLVDLLLDQAPGTVKEPDLVVLAYARPETNGFKTVASYLNMRTGGEAHSFALCGQGIGASFSAVRVADAYARTGRSERSLIAVVDCAEPGSAEQQGDPAVDSGVLLGFDTGPGPGAVRPSPPWNGPPSWRSASPLWCPTAGACWWCSARAPIPGSCRPRARILHRAAPAGTGVWTELACHWAQWESAYPVVALCDTDGGSGTGHLLVLHGTLD